MKIERDISWFDKTTERFVAEKNVDFIDLSILREIFQPPDEDPLMYNPYPIRETEANKLSQHLDFKYEFEKYNYYIECYDVT